MFTYLHLLTNYFDGVFLPPENKGVGTVYFCEVQFQKNEQLYERVFAESALYFYRNRARFSDWQAVIIYPFRSIEQKDVYPHSGLLNSEQVHRVYLNELGDIRSLPLWVALMVLTTVDEKQAPQEARYLLTRTQQEVSQPKSRVNCNSQFAIRNSQLKPHPSLGGA